MVITSVCHSHTRLHTPLSNICSSSCRHSTHSWVNFSCLPFTATVNPIPSVEIRPIASIGTALSVMTTVIVHHYHSVKTAQPRDRTTDPAILIPEPYALSQTVISLVRVVVTLVRHTHTRLHNVNLKFVAFMLIITMCLELTPEFP